MNNRIIVFAPHPDDETLGCGGNIVKKLNEDYEVIIVIVTDGRNVFTKILGINSDPSPEELKKIRENEVKRAMKILGVPEKNLIFLNFEDGMLEKCENEAEEEVIKILTQIYPTEIYLPYGKDINPDHRATNRIVKNAIRKLNISMLAYEYSIMQKYRKFGPIINSIINLIKQNMIFIDISKYVFLKKLAIQEFKSQISIISKKQQKPIFNEARINMYLKNKEMYYVVHTKYNL